MIKYNLNNINDWYFDTSNIIKVCRNNAVCYYKVITSGDTPTFDVCYAVVDDISQYSDTEFEDVFNNADNKWYKLNNLNQYEEYGVYGSGRTITYYDGKLTIDEETIPQPPRLPVGYTEVEYIRQNNNYNAYINTGVYLFDSTSNSYTVTTKLTSEFHSNLGCATIISAEVPASPYNGMGYRYKCSSTVDQLEFFGGNPNYTSSVVDNGDGTRTVTFQSTGNTSWTSSAPLSLLCSFSNTSFTTPFRYADATIYSATIVKNGTTVRDFVPAKRDSDSVYGFYDLITDTFYDSPNGNNFIGGSEVTPTASTTCEFIYSGGSWINLGEVSGGTIQTVWFDPPSSGDNARFDIGHYWGENYKMIWTMYIQGSYSNDTSSFWKYENKTPIEFSLYSNGYYYDMHNPTSTSSPSVQTGDYSYRILRTNVFRNYENSQVMNITLTYGSFKAELVDSGTVIENTGSTRTGFSWYNGLYESSIFLQSTQKCHLSRIQVYNASNVLINDIKFVKNNGVIGSQEISMYDSVLNVTYNNTNSNTPTYHIVEEGGGVEYPVYYDEIQDPPNNLSFSSMTEAEEYECPWVGMKATIDGDKYVFSGDSQSGYEWVYNPSRLPSGYTEVEYIQNTETSYINTNIQIYSSTTNSFEVEAKLIAAKHDSSAYQNVFSCVSEDGEPYQGFTYRYQSSSLVGTSIPNGQNTFTIVNNEDSTQTVTVTSSSSQRTYTHTYPLTLFCGLNSSRNPFRWTNSKFYYCKIKMNNELVRDLVPCKRDSDDKYGMYDLVTNTFYVSPNNVDFIGGYPV